GVGQFLVDLVEFGGGGLLVAFADDEPTTDGEVGLVQQDPAIGADGPEADAVGVAWQHGQRVLDHVLDGVLEVVLGAQFGAEAQGAGFGDIGQALVDLVGQDLLRFKALQAQEDSREGAVSPPGGGQGTVDVDAQVGGFGGQL